ncbi:hypothetical protein [Burkholderia cenocepacia]|uniref:hypothetical protein n=1 Tax=Burkholderia cenocepacia TaxID=95486 RepID=UPI0038CC03B1
MRATYTVAPYGIKLVYTDDVKTFNALSDVVGLRRHEASGACAEGRKGGYVVGVFDRSWLTLVHECTHAAMLILPAVGIDPASNSAESLAYLVENLVGVGAKRLGLR